MKIIYIIICLLILFLVGCDKQIPIRQESLSRIHIWCEGCESEIICTYITDDGFSAYCSGCWSNYRNRKWNQEEYKTWVAKNYSQDDVLRVNQMEKEYKVIYVD